MSIKVRLLLEKFKCFVLIVLDEYWRSLSCLFILYRYRCRFHVFCIISQVYLWPAPTTTGMKAGRTVEAILHLAGLKNVKSKVTDA